MQSSPLTVKNLGNFYIPPKIHKNIRKWTHSTLEKLHCSVPQYMTSGKSLLSLSKLFHSDCFLPEIKACRIKPPPDEREPPLCRLGTWDAWQLSTQPSLKTPREDGQGALQALKWQRLPHANRLVNGALCAQAEVVSWAQLPSWRPDLEASDHHAWSLTHFEIYKATIDSGWEEKSDPEAAQRRALRGPAPGPPSQSSLGPCMSALAEALSAEALNEVTGDPCAPGGCISTSLIASPLHTLGAHVDSEGFQFPEFNICLFVYCPFSLIRM